MVRTYVRQGREHLRKPCDGTPQDYKRHRNHGEEPCEASKDAYNADMRRKGKKQYYKYRPWSERQVKRSVPDPWDCDASDPL